MGRTLWIGWGFAIATALGVVACGGGGGGNGGPTNPSPAPGGPTITIDGNGQASPTTLTVQAGQRVTFVNNHNRQHDMSSDPHPEHTNCPEVTVGNLQPGQNRQTQVLNTRRSCGFHDHNEPDNRSLAGTIVIQ